MPRTFTTRSDRRSAPYPTGALLQHDHTVGDALQLQILRQAAHVVEQQRGASKAPEAVLQREDLPPVPQRGLSQQAQLRQAVEDEPLRALLSKASQDPPGGLPEIEIGRMKQGLLLLGVKGGLGQHLHHRDTVERPAMARRRGPEFVCRLAERDVHAALSQASALKQELQRERRLARAGSAFDHIDSGAGQAAGEDVIKAGDAGQGAIVGAVRAYGAHPPAGRVAHSDLQAVWLVK